MPKTSKELQKIPILLILLQKVVDKGIWVVLINNYNDNGNVPLKNYERNHDYT